MSRVIDHVAVPLAADSAVQAFLHEHGDNLAKLRKHIEAMRKKMLEAAENLEFEEAARLRDEIKQLEENELGL